MSVKSRIVGDQPVGAAVDPHGHPGAVRDLQHAGQANERAVPFGLLTGCDLAVDDHVHAGHGHMGDGLGLDLQRQAPRLPADFLSGAFPIDLERQQRSVGGEAAALAIGLEPTLIGEGRTGPDVDPSGPRGQVIGGVEEGVGSRRDWALKAAVEQLVPVVGIGVFVSLAHHVDGVGGPSAISTGYWEGRPGCT